jgi:hypothetical protein
LSSLPHQRPARTILASLSPRSVQYLSLDRIIPVLGYVRGNVRVVCFAVNQARSDYGDEVLLIIAKALVERAAGCVKELTS